MPTKTVIDTAKFRIQEKRALLDLADSCLSLDDLLRVSGPAKAVELDRSLRGHPSFAVLELQSWALDVSESLRKELSSTDK